MAVLITGGTGLIGSCVVRNLLDLGETPVVLDVAEPGFSLQDLFGKYIFVKGNITDLGAVTRVMESHKIASVIHLGGLLQFGCEHNPQKAIEINVMGTMNVMEASRSMGIKKIIFASSSAAYGSQTGVSDIDEQSPISPDLPLYGATKLLGENLMERYYRNYGIPYIALRYSAVYGPGEVSSPGMAMVIKKIESTISGQDAVIEEVAGEDRRNFTFVKDAAAATIKALFTEKNKHRVFNITGGEKNYVSSLEFHRIIKKLVPSAGQAIFTGKGRDRGMFDISLAQEELGYFPTYSLEQGISEDIDFFLSL